MDKCPKCGAVRVNHHASPEAVYDCDTREWTLGERSVYRSYKCLTAENARLREIVERLAAWYRSPDRLPSVAWSIASDGGNLLSATEAEGAG